MFELYSIIKLAKVQKEVERSLNFDQVRTLPCYRDWESYKWLEKILAGAFVDIDTDAHKDIPWIQKFQNTLVIVVDPKFTAPQDLPALEHLPVFEMQKTSWKIEENKFIENIVEFLTKSELMVTTNPRKIVRAAHDLDQPGIDQLQL